MKKHYHRSRGSPEPKKPEKSNDIRNIIILLIFSILPYYPSITGSFVFDDAESIVNNPIVNGKESISQIFTRDFWGRPIRSPHSHKSYRPITTFTFWINYEIHGMTTIGYHLVNVLLHAAATILVYKVVKDLEKVFQCLDIAFYAALLFAVHPIHTEAVANITGRAEILMTFFSLLAIKYWLHNKNEPMFFILVIFSTLSKEQGIMTIPIVLAIEFWMSHDFKKHLRNFAAMFLSIGIGRHWINGFEAAKFTQLDNSAAFIDSKFWKVINTTYLWLYHAFLLIAPTNLCFDYSMGCIPIISSFTDWRALSPVLLLVFAFIFLIFRNESRMATFGVILGGLAFLPSSNMFFTVGFTIAERILYLPSVGFCILCAVLYQKLLHKYQNAEVIAYTVLLLAVSKTYTRSQEWKSEVSLYSSGLSVCPMNAKIHYNLGKVLGDHGKTKDAEINYWNAIKLNPNYESALNNLGNLLEKSGDSQTAETLLARAVNIKPSFAVAWMNLGITQMNLKKFDNAEKSFRNSLKVRPHSAHCLFNLGILYQKTNRELLAMSAWINATSIEPSHSQAWTNLFVVLDHLELCEEVIHLSKKALKYVPFESSIYMQIGACYAQKSRFDEAERFILAAIDLKPTFSLYRSNLDILYQRMRHSPNHNSTQN